MKKLSPFIPALVLAAATLALPTTRSEASGSLNAFLTCEPMPGGAICEASPQGSGLSYSWTYHGLINVVASGAVARVTCNTGFADGTLVVTVTDSTGQQGTTSRTIDCSQVPGL